MRWVLLACLLLSPAVVVAEDLPDHRAVFDGTVTARVLSDEPHELRYRFEYVVRESTQDGFLADDAVRVAFLQFTSKPQLEAVMVARLALRPRHELVIDPRQALQYRLAVRGVRGKLPGDKLPKDWPVTSAGVPTIDVVELIIEPQIDKK